MKPKQIGSINSKAFAYTLRDLKIDNENIFDPLATNASNNSMRKGHQRRQKHRSNSTIDKKDGELPIYQPSYSRAGRVSFNTFQIDCNQGQQQQNFQLMNALTQIENQYIEAGNFLQAEQIRVRKQSIRKQLSSQRKSQLIRRTIRSKDEQIKRMNQQFENDLRDWQQQLNRLIENVKQGEKQLLSQQHLQLEQLQKQFQENFQEQISHIKFSSQTLNLQNKLERSIQLHSYIEAQNLKLELQHRTLQEKQHYRRRLYQNIQKKRKNIANKHQKQLENFRFKYRNILEQRIAKRNEQLDKKNNVIERKNVQRAQSRQKAQQLSFSRANTHRKRQIKSQRS